MAEQGKRAKLKNLDDLFMLNAPSPPPAGTPELGGHCHMEVAVADLTPFRAHPFRLYEGERLEDMVESIRKNGVLVPIIIRRLGNLLEILSGHNRVGAAKLAGLDAVPAILLDDISDDEAWVYVIETNLMQRSFSDMAHSEKAAVIAMQHAKLFSQGKRNDIIAMLKELENPHGDRTEGTSTQTAEKYDSGEKVAERYSLSADTVTRYLRINKLIPNLKIRLDDEAFGFIPAVALSFLTGEEQGALDRCLGRGCFKVDMKKAALLRELSRKGKLAEDSIYAVLSGEIGASPRPNRTPTVKVRKTVYAKYFRPEQSAAEVQDIVEKALALYFTGLNHKEEAL